MYHTYIMCTMYCMGHLDCWRGLGSQQQAQALSSKVWVFLIKTPYSTGDKHAQAIWPGQQPLGGKKTLFLAILYIILYYILFVV